MRKGPRHRKLGIGGFQRKGKERKGRETKGYPMCYDLSEVWRTGHGEKEGDGQHGTDVHFCYCWTTKRGPTWMALEDTGAWFLFLLLRLFQFISLDDETPPGEISFPEAFNLFSLTQSWEEATDVGAAAVVSSSWAQAYSYYGERGAGCAKDLRSENGASCHYYLLPVERKPNSATLPIFSTGLSLFADRATQVGPEAM
jgi:hypothetical protein